jgi:hypothetical protein
MLSTCVTTRSVRNQSGGKIVGLERVRFQQLDPTPDLKPQHDLVIYKGVADDHLLVAIDNEPELVDVPQSVQYGTRRFELLFHFV